MKAEICPHWDKDIMDSCPMLYCTRGQPMSKTCMCWGFECGIGWRDPLQELSSALEAMNILFYPKHHVRIQADQVKEKFGELRFYYSVVADQTAFQRMKRKLYALLFSFPLKIVNQHIDSIEGKRRTQSDKAKLSFTYKLSSFLEGMLASCYSMTQKQAAIREFLDAFAREQVRKAETACRNVCETCGTSIGKNGISQDCTYVGWIKHVCTNCAKMSGLAYHIGNGMQQYRYGKKVTKNSLSPKKSKPVTAIANKKTSKKRTASK